MSLNIVACVDHVPGLKVGAILSVLTNWFLLLRCLSFLFRHLFNFKSSTDVLAMNLTVFSPQPSKVFCLFSCHVIFVSLLINRMICFLKVMYTWGLCSVATPPDFFIIHKTLSWGKHFIFRLYLVNVFVSECIQFLHVAITRTPTFLCLFCFQIALFSMHTDKRGE